MSKNILAPIPNSCIPGNCNKNPEQMVNCQIICQIPEERLSELACWNNGRGFWGDFRSEADRDPLAWNRRREQTSSFPSASVIKHNLRGLLSDFDE